MEKITRINQVSYDSISFETDKDWQIVFLLNNCSSIHYQHEQEFVGFEHISVDDQSVYQYSCDYDTFLILEKIFNNYKIMELTKELIKSDPVSTPEEILSKAKVLFEMQVRFLNEPITNIKK